MKPPSRTSEWNHAEELLSPEEFKEKLRGSAPTTAFIRYEDKEDDFIWQSGLWPAVEDKELYTAAEKLSEEEENVIKFADELLETKPEAGTLIYDALQFVRSEEWTHSRNADTAAAAAIRLSEEYTPKSILQKEIADVASRAPQTVNKAYKEAKEDLNSNY